MFVTYKLSATYDINAPLIVTVISGIYVFPLFAFSALAGQIADKYEKSMLVRRIKIGEILLMGVTAFAFETESLYSLIFLLFVMGIKTAMFGPLKFSILPQHLTDDELVAGNGFVSAGTNIAILTGTIFGGLCILAENGAHYTAAALVAAAVAGWVSSLFIRTAPPSDADLKVDANIFKGTWRVMSFPFAYKQIITCIVCISWFWGMSSILLAQFPTYAKDIIGGDKSVYTLFVVIATAGIGVGSTLCNKLLKGRVSGRYLPATLVCITVFMVVFVITGEIFTKPSELMSVGEFLKLPSAWLVCAAEFVALSFVGLYNVQLYAILQKSAPKSHMSRVIASTNITDSFAMVLAAVYSTVLIGAGMSINRIFLTLAVLNILYMPFILKIAKGNYD